MAIASPNASSRTPPRLGKARRLRSARTRAWSASSCAASSAAAQAATRRAKAPASIRAAMATSSASPPSASARRTASEHRARRSVSTFACSIRMVPSETAPSATGSCPSPSASPTSRWAALRPPFPVRPRQPTKSRSPARAHRPSSECARRSLPRASESCSAARSIPVITSSLRSRSHSPATDVARASAWAAWMADSMSSPGAGEPSPGVIAPVPPIALPPPHRHSGIERLYQQPPRYTPRPTTATPRPFPVDEGPRESRPRR